MAFFTSKGRLRRRTFFFRGLVLYALAIVIYGIPSWLYAADIPEHVKLIAGLGMMAVWYLLLVQTVLRLHDLGLSGWWALIALLPLATYVLGPGVQLVQGTIGPNRFGPDPKRPELLPLAAAPQLPESPFAEL